MSQCVENPSLTEMLMSQYDVNTPNVCGRNTRQWFERHKHFPAVPAFFFLCIGGLYDA